jgi:hypothetical protein
LCKQKNSKEHKDHKDTTVDVKGLAKEVVESKQFEPEKSIEIGHVPVEITSELNQLIKRVSSLEQSVAELKRSQK